MSGSEDIKNEDLAHLQTSQFEPFKDDTTEVSRLLSRTFWLNTSTLIGGNEATLRFILYL
jgi:hypothetical protein